jgi:Carbamoyltransferase C-terminus
VASVFCLGTIDPEAGTFPYQEFLSWMARIVQADRGRLVATNETLPIGFSISMHSRCSGYLLSQFVEEQDNPQNYGLLREFKRVTGFGVLINTSFNLHGRTIVRTADDAITDFLDCGIDELYLEGYRITRAVSAAPQA